MRDEDKRILINLICNEQTDMIIKDKSAYESEYYKQLEKLKIKVKDLSTEQNLVKEFFTSWEYQKEEIEMVTLYSTHCPRCLVLEKKLKQKNISYQEVNDI